MLTLAHPHSWDLTPREAIELQRSLGRYVLTRDDLPLVRRVAGVDCGFESQGSVIRAAVAVLSFPDLALIDQAIIRLPTCFPYVPGLLSFRELPAILAALKSLAELPDLILVDGQGYAHPRRCGIASHLGVLTGLATIGVGKSRLFGAETAPALQRGAWTPLLADTEIVGATLRSRAGVKPIYVSIGHRVALETAIDWVLRCTTRYRLPETTRWAHRLASG